MRTRVPELSGLMDNLLMMRFVEVRAELRRTAPVLKVRDSSYEPSVRELVVTNRGSIWNARSSRRRASCRAPCVRRVGVNSAGSGE